MLSREQNFLPSLCLKYELLLQDCSGGEESANPLSPLLFTTARARPARDGVVAEIARPSSFSVRAISQDVIDAAEISPSPLF